VPQRSLAERLRAVGRRGRGGEAPDWETITGSQYSVRRTTHSGRGQNGDPVSRT